MTRYRLITVRILSLMDYITRRKSVCVYIYTCVCVCVCVVETVNDVLNIIKAVTVFVASRWPHTCARSIYSIQQQQFMLMVCSKVRASTRVAKLKGSLQFNAVLRTSRRLPNNSLSDALTG